MKKAILTMALVIGSLAQAKVACQLEQGFYVNGTAQLKSSELKSIIQNDQMAALSLREDGISATYEKSVATDHEVIRVSYKDLSVEATPGFNSKGVASLKLNSPAPDIAFIQVTCQQQ